MVCISYYIIIIIIALWLGIQDIQWKRRMKASAERDTEKLKLHEQKIFFYSSFFYIEYLFK